MFQYMESRHGFDMYVSSYNGEHYTIQYNPEKERIEQMRPINDRLAALFQSYIQD
ncbi:hypothetical protein [Salibacterium qingdaonense]|uniref:Uncharacterized protein n=1 Tax=Salibacterium qingdaonense TaxID=266892 RepID=A0A1I4JRB2_9BACI|nr:hypothetical protein [Salibacterium qingdaonense]SFL68656.1 hypothetical protein SAMN04488054_103289 [Salibacterium qingdaonense]